MAITKKNTIPLPVRVEYCFTDEILSFIRIFDVYAIVSLKPGIVFKEFYSSPGSVDFSEKKGDRPAGTFYQSQLKLFFPGVDHVTEASLFTLDKKKVILKIYFNDISCRIVGNPEAPVRLSTEVVQNNAKSGISVTGDVQSTEKSRFLTAEDNIIPPPEL